MTEGRIATDVSSYSWTRVRVRAGVTVRAGVKVRARVRVSQGLR